MFLLWQTTTKKVMKEFNFDIYIMFKFGTSITALYPVIQKLLTNVNSKITLDSKSVVLLTTCALAIILHESKDEIQKLKIVIEEKNLNRFLPKVIEFLKLNFSVFKVLASKIGKTVETLYDLLAYNVLYVPFMSALLEIVIKNNLNIDNVFKYIVTTSIGVLMLYSKHFIEEIIQNVKKKLKK